MSSTQVAGAPGLDPTLPNIVLILGGVERHLCYDHNAIVQAEHATGINLPEASLRFMSATALRGLLWAALLKENPGLTIEEVGSWIHPRQFKVIHDALVATWYGSVPEAKDGEEGEVQGQASPNA